MLLVGTKSISLRQNFFKGCNYSESIKKCIQYIFKKTAKDKVSPNQSLLTLRTEARHIYNI